MNEPPLMIMIHTTFDEIVALQAAVAIYLDVLEVVESFESERTRRESIHQLEAFKDRCQKMNAHVHEQSNTLFLMQIPFHEFMVVITAIEAYEFLDKIHCVPTHTLSGLTSIEVITQTRRFQRRMVSTQPEN